VAYDPTGDASYTYTVKDAGIRTGELTAWRVWRLAGPTLVSLSMPCAWHWDEPMEGDPYKAGEGVHAFKGPLGALGYLDDIIHSYGGPACEACVLGSVELWGDVIAHEGGYRAQWARPASLEHVFLSNGSGIERAEAKRWLEHARELYSLDGA
jgi:hypothetical protein